MTTPTGTHHRLRLAGTRAEVGTVAAVLRGLSVDGVELAESLAPDAAPAFGSGIVLSPWPNRVRDGRWTLDGRILQLDITEVSFANAIHGLLRFAEYRVRDESESAVTLAAVVYPQHGWPFLLDTWVRYALVPDGLVVTHGVTNLSGQRAPYAVGTHPFLRVGATPVEELTLTIRANRFIEVDDRLLPLGSAAVDGTAFDIRSGARVGDLRLDTAYAELDPVDSVVATLAAPSGETVSLWQDPAFGYLQAFTTPDFPRPQAPAGRRIGTAIALEPMTAPPDALNSGEGLLWLEPGQAWEASWGVRYSRV